MSKDTFIWPFTNLYPFTNVYPFHMRVLGYFEKSQWTTSGNFFVPQNSQRNIDSPKGIRVSDEYGTRETHSE